MLNGISDTCPCGSGEQFKTCCDEFISGTKTPETAEQLMRSRYCAYVLKNEDYLLNSWHPTTRPEKLKLQNDLSQWKKLKIIFSSENKVHFVAFFITSIEKIEPVFALYEQSEFIKEDENWFYVSGAELKTIELSKNMLCPCNSGKKFKRCCAIKL